MAFEFHIWSLDLNLGFKPTSFNFVASCISQNTPILPCHSMHHIVAYCHVMIVFRCVFRGRFCLRGYPPFSDWRAISSYHSIAGNCPFSVDVASMMRSMTPMKNYIIFRSARQAKTPCSFRYNPTLSLLLSFTALGQQWFNCYMLR